MESIKDELRLQKNIVKQQKREIEKLKIQNSGLLEKLKRYETNPSENYIDSDIEIIEIDPEPEVGRCYSKHEISKFKQLKLRSGVELDNIPVYDLDNFVAIVSEKANQIRVKLPKPPGVQKLMRKRKRAPIVQLKDSDSYNINESSDDDLEYYKNTCKLKDNFGSSKNLRKLINAGKHLKSKIKAGANLPDGVELV